MQGPRGRTQGRETVSLEWKAPWPGVPPIGWVSALNGPRQPLEPTRIDCQEMSRLKTNYQGLTMLAAQDQVHE